MTTEQIHALVKKLEPLFIGYSAVENRLRNSNGMELAFKIDWKNQTRVLGLHASKTHSIGCSFEKPVEKIFKDIRRRLLAEYHADFFETKREEIKRSEADEEEKLKMRALASVVNGEIERNYGHRFSGTSEYVNAKNISIYRTYSGRHEFHINLSYFDSMRLAKILHELSFIEQTKVEDCVSD